MSINITVTPTGSGSLNVGTVTDTQADVTVGSATTVGLVVNNGVGPAGSGSNTILAAGSGISIATSSGTSTISATAVDVSASNISDLANVNSTAPNTGQVLTYTASNEWAPANVASADHAHDVPTFQEITNGTATTTSSLNLDPATGVVIVQGGTSGSGSLTLNCENNSHGVTIKGPPHSSNATYSLTLPDGIGTSGQVLSSDGTGFLQWITPSSGSGSGSGGVSWSSVPSGTSSTGTPGDIAYDATYFYVCTGSGWRRTALAGWGQSIIINTQPSNFTTTDATTATFSVNATAPLGSLNYQWQISTNGGSSWAAITGANGSSYSFTAGVTDTGNQYRVVLSATSATSDEISDAVTLTVAITNYITTESGDPLDAESGDNILHDGVGAGTGDFGGGGGGGATLQTLTDVSHVAGGTYTIQGSGNDYLGHEKLLFNNDGTELFAAYDIGHINIQSASDTWTPSVWHETSVNNWQELSNLQLYFGSTGYISPRCWMPRSISMAGNANKYAGAVMQAGGDLAWYVFTASYSNYSSANTLLIDYTGASGDQTDVQVGNYIGSSRFPQEEQVYNTALSANGMFLAANVPWVDGTQGSYTSRDALRIFNTTTTNGSQIGDDIKITPMAAYSGSTHLLGTIDLKVSDDGKLVTFTAGSFNVERVHRWAFEANSLGEYSWIEKAVSPLLGSAGIHISADQNRFVFVDVQTGDDNVKIYKINSYGNGYDLEQTITKPSGYDFDSWAASAALSADGGMLAISAGSANDEPDVENSENEGAVIVYRKEGTNDYTQYTEPFYGPVDYALFNNLTISPDGSRIAVQGPNYEADTSNPGSYTNIVNGRVFILSVPSVPSDNPVINTQPTSQVFYWPTVNSVQLRSYSILASNESGTTITYQWQYSTNGYSGWTNAPASWTLATGAETSTTNSNSTTNVLKVYVNNTGASGTAERNEWDGVAWRCLVSSGGQTTTSTVAYSYVQHLTVTGTSGNMQSPVTMSVNVVRNPSATITYQWFTSGLASTSSWSPVANNGTSSSLYNFGNFGVAFKCLVTNTTDGVTISEYGPTNNLVNY